MSRQTTSRVIVVAMICVALVGAAWLEAGIPEPGLTIYGKVLNGDVLVTDGVLVSEYTPYRGGAVVRVSTTLQAFTDDSGEEFSYRLYVPAETAAAGSPVGSNTLPYALPGAPYIRNATVDGTPVSAVRPGFAYVGVSTLSRASVQRVDLTFSPTTLVSTVRDNAVNYIVNGAPLTDDEKREADANGDGHLDVADMIILEVLAGL